MFQKTLVFLCCSFFLILVSACKKEDVQTYDSLDDFFEKQLETERFVADASGSSIIIEGKQGTKLFISTDAFEEPQDQVVIRFAEFFRKSDLILNNIPTNSINNEILESGGSFYLDIRNSEEEFISIRENIDLAFPVQNTIANPDNMSVWNGVFDRPVNTGMWAPVSADRSSVVTGIDQNTSELTFFMNTPKFTWINCDYVFDSPTPRVVVEAEVLNPADVLNEIRSFIVFKNINAVLGLTPENRTFKSFEIPVGEEAYLVMLGHGDGLYLKIEPFTIAANQHFELELEKVSENELKEELLLLD